MADYFDYYLSTYDDPDEPKQRYLIDIKSEAHQTAIRNNLTYLEGVIYNGINYFLENGYGYEESHDWYIYFNTTEKEYDTAFNNLIKKNLITVIDGQVALKRLTYDQLKEDQTMKDMGLSDLMEAFKTMMLEVNNG